jgi:L-ribulose-5-phosphate 3-epimerase
VIDRRQFLMGVSALPLFSCMGIDSVEQQWQVGICDWSAGSKGVPDVFKTVRGYKLDGVQLSYVPRHEQFDLRRKETQKYYLDVAKSQNVKISSMAMGIFNQRPFATFDDSLLWADECLDIMLGLNVKVVLFAFFGKGDIRGKPKLQRKVIERLKVLTPKAEKYGLTLGLETWLNQEEHMAILDAVGSESVKVFYDTANMDKMGYDIHKEIRWLGKKNAICQIHMKENGKRLGWGRVNFPRVKEDLIEIGYKNWLIIEGAVEGDLYESQVANGKYLNGLFNN